MREGQAREWDYGGALVKEGTKGDSAESITHQARA